METLIVRIKDNSKVDFLLELLRDLAYVEVSQVPASAETTEPKVAEPEGSEADFWALAGIWKDRDIDGHQWRQQAWHRANGSQL